MAKKEKHNIEVYKSWCKKCGICVAFCPAGVLAQDDSGAPYAKEPDKCTGCQLCALRCPDFAINVTSPKKKERKGSAKATEDIKEGVSEQGEKA
jgi:2-oxoglutarate ferredoxin oxidoreductase subunit delta